MDSQEKTLELGVEEVSNATKVYDSKKEVLERLLLVMKRQRRQRWII